MLFKDIKKEHYKCFSRQKDESKTKNIESVKYIELLANSSGVDISEWDIHELFAQSANTMVSDRREINRRFFEHAEQLQAGRVAENVTLLDTIKNSLKRVESRIAASAITNCERRQREYLDMATQSQRDFENSMRRAAEEGVILRRLSVPTTGDSNIVLSIESLNAGDFWRFVEFKEREAQIVFETKVDIILTEINTEAGLNLSVNLGRFKATVPITDIFGVRILNDISNTTVEGYPHPHVSSSGGLCWGNGADSARRLATSHDLLGFMTLLSSLLVTYNPGNPYKPLHKFQERQQEIARANDPELQRIHEEELAEARRVQEEFEAARRREEESIPAEEEDVI